MPELPEVETVRRTLIQLIVGKTIEQATVSLPRIIQKPDDTMLFEEALAGRTFMEIDRRGKFLRMVLDGIILVSHLRMEGRYGVYAHHEPVEPHTHVIFRFTDGSELRYRDVRQFGTMHLFAPGEEWTSPPLNKLGLEPLSDNFTCEAFRSVLAHRSSKLKPLLLNQAYVTGLGNIYVDEALYEARIHPEQTADSLSAQEWQTLHQAVVKTLSEAVRQGGSSIKSYVNGQGEMGMFQQQLQAYGRSGEACARCGNPIVKIVLAGRGTHFCQTCQRMKRSRKRTAASVKKG
ncbi:DNA-formamidopyrimidine glycosylase [Xylanibacillus composti]|uniref:Formamidopyrimidine-DNA glycosylase n=1 Tax=Xylanibacillus composti TaxID=1572762 RepID=A0A8J4M2M1_9BACL|nr:DNA-formamidopyrimidine glycosylase [Xylanibacillus composti]MDT9724818.1 DNA-formamidopyrimidine glycosylase [Xylanibacillus composti]GIQ69829.1 formamidopyrimidine-DNA glycosylase [Xylanibacillus composti]